MAKERTKRAKSLKDIEAQTAKITEELERRGVDKGNNAERMNKVYDIRNKYVRNIMNSQEGKDYEKDNTALTKKMNNVSRLPNSRQQYTDLFNQRNKNTEEFYNKKFSYSTRQGIAG